MTDVMSIDECQYIGRGTVKLVFTHPAFPGAVIKIVNPASVDGEGQFLGQASYKRKRKSGIYRLFQREIDQYFSLCRGAYPASSRHFPMAAPKGLVQTSIGLGLVSEFIGTGDGQIAPTLSDLVRTQQFTDIHSRALDRFFEDCIDMHVVLGEINSSGLLFTTNRSARAEFVIVDGIGEKNLIPLKTWSFAINRRHVLNVRTKILAECRQVLAGSFPVMQSKLGSISI